MSHNRSIDSTQADIARVWQQFGFWVHDLHLAAQGYQFEYMGQIVHGGIPDLLCQLGGVSVWVECKSPGGGLEESEAAFLQMCALHHVPAVVNWSIEDAARDAQQWRAMALLARGWPK